MRWQQLTSSGWVPGAREGHSSDIIGSKLYIFGGMENSMRINSTLLFDVGERVWKQVLTTGEVPPGLT
jgi:tRNA wybutosine-synthesizing protein 3